MHELLLDRLHPEMDVCDAEDAKIGTLARIHRMVPAGTREADARPVRDSILEVKGGFLGLGPRYYVPLSAVTHVADDGAFLLWAKDDLESLGWHEKPPHLD
jgi:hypothetical protein